MRRDVLRLPEAEGPRAGEAGAGPPLSLLLIGDSSAAGVGVAQQSDALAGRLVRRLARSHRVEWRLVAQIGWTTADALDALETGEGASFDAAIIQLGVNDVTTETGIGPWLATYERLVGVLEARFRVRHMLLGGLPPMGRFPALPQPLRWYLGRQAVAHDRALGTFARGYERLEHVTLPSGLDVSAMAADGFHPGPAVYAALADAFAAVLERRLGAGGH